MRAGLALMGGSMPARDDFDGWPEAGEKQNLIFTCEGFSKMVDPLVVTEGEPKGNQLLLWGMLDVVNWLKADGTCLLYRVNTYVA